MQFLSNSSQFSFGFWSRFSYLCFNPPQHFLGVHVGVSALAADLAQGGHILGQFIWLIVLNLFMSKCCTVPTPSVTYSLQGRVAFGNINSPLLGLEARCRSNRIESVFDMVLHC